MTKQANSPNFDIDLAGKIDHTILKPDASASQIRQLCEEAQSYRFASVCVHPIWVSLCAKTLEINQPKTGSAGKSPSPLVCTVVGFPHGAQLAETKARETELAIGQGASEIDMVIPISALKDGDLDLVAKHVSAVVKAAGTAGLVKVIIENCYLSDSEKRQACQICVDAGAGYVKTSTGFGSGGATLEDVRLMREVVGETVGVKAAGGIRDRETAWKFIDAGASRIGTSSGVAMTKV